MMEEGLLEEVKELKKLNIPKTATSMQSLGYREIMGYLDGEYDLERAVYLIKLNTRHFAKRQLTWFRNERGVRFIDVMKEDAVDMIVKEYEKHV
jgi:tRNA dimethylallyltransferase